MFLLISIAKPLVILLLTEKWLPSVDLFQILCFNGMLYTISVINHTILKAKGLTILFFRVEIWNPVVGVIILIFSIYFGLKGLVIGQVFTSFVYLFINAYYSWKYINYGIVRQMMDISIFVLISISLCGATLFAIQSFNSNLVQVIAGIVIYIGTYFMILKLFRFDELNEFRAVLLMPFQKVSNKVNL